MHSNTDTSISIPLLNLAFNPNFLCTVLGFIHHIFVLFMYKMQCIQIYRLLQEKTEHSILRIIVKMCKYFPSEF